MINYSNFFTNSIEKFKSENRYREFVNLSRICNEFPYAIDNETGKKISIWCSNDYLAMGQNQVAMAKAVEAIKKYGLGSGGTRNISGTNKEVVDLENEIANLYQRQKALSFVSGYVCNDSSIQALAKIIPNLIIFSDEKNHASIISGIRNSRLEKNIFRHNDINHLEELLKKYSFETPKLIIFESVYSMDGDFGKVEEIVNLAKKYNCLTYCDEVHGVGIYGEKGEGYCYEIGFGKEIDIIQGTFGKAFGVIGGFISGKEEIIDAIRLNSSGFIFSTALPPMIAACVRQNIINLRDNNELRIFYKNRIANLKKALKEAEIAVIENDSHIISIKIGDAKKAQEISKRLKNEFQIYVQHINYPTVARGDERLRITITPLHNDKMIAEFVEALKICLKIYF